MILDRMARVFLPGLLLALLPIAASAAPSAGSQPARTEIENGAWSALTTLGALPGSRVESSSVYDPINQRWIVFGGQGMGDTWALNLGSGTPSWVSLNPANAPTPRRAASIVFDPIRSRLILFGGDDGNFRNDVWAYNLTGTGNWTQLAPAGTLPPGRMWTIGAYDPIRDRIVYFGGYRSTLLNDVWALNLSTVESWEQLSPANGPDARWSCVGAYDPAGDRMIVALGLGANDVYKSDAWALNLSGTPIWSPLPVGTTVPAGRFLATGVFEAARSRLIVYGGYPSGAGDVWALNIGTSSSWDFLAPGGVAPPGRRAHVSVFQPEASRMLTLGGLDQNNSPFALTFTPAGSTTPTLTAFSPPGGPVGTSVTIAGLNLDTATLVEFNGTAAAIDSKTATQIQTHVPAGATSGKIRVTTPNGTVTSGADFTVGNLPIITSASPDSGRVRSRIVLHGTYFTGATRVSLGGSGSTVFTVLSDTVIAAVVDTLGRTGHVFVITPVGTGESAFDFHVIPPDSRPRMTSVRDVPHDQGGHVVIRWEGSDLDVPWRRSITGYRVWRRAPAGAASSGSVRGAEIDGLRPGAGPAADVYWEAVAQLPAAALEGYAYTAVTPSDSTADGNAPVAFFVQATTADPYTYFSSSPDSGYSVDNLSPPQPAPFVAEYGTYQVALRWGRNRAADFKEFHLHRGGSAGFAISPANQIASMRDTSYVDPTPGAAGHYYKLVAIDLHGNASRVALVSPDVPVSALAALVSAEASERWVRLTWYSGGNPGLAVRVYRHDDHSDWTRLTDLVGDGSGYIRCEDTDVISGTRYAYRLGIDDGDTEVFTNEVWVTAETSRFALLGPWPNPSSSGRFSVAFELPSTERAALDLWDVAGRRIEHREIGSETRGRRVADFGATRRLAPGLYLLRMTQGAARLQRRVVVLN